VLKIYNTRLVKKFQKSRTLILKNKGLRKPMRTLLKGSKNLQNHGMLSISKLDPIIPQNLLSPSHLRLSYPSSLIIPATSYRIFLYFLFDNLLT